MPYSAVSKEFKLLLLLLLRNHILLLMSIKQEFRKLHLPFLDAAAFMPFLTIRFADWNVMMSWLRLQFWQEWFGGSEVGPCAPVNLYRESFFYRINRFATYLSFFFRFVLMFFFFRNIHHRHHVPFKKSHLRLVLVFEFSSSKFWVATLSLFLFYFDRFRASH